MRRLSLGLIALALIIGLIRRCDAGDRDLDREVRKQVYQLAEEMLAGRSLLLRIYTDPAAHPDAFQRVTAPLRGCTVSFDAIKSVFGPIPDKAVIVVLGSDQTDRQVTAVLDNFVFARAYRPQGEPLYLQPPFFEDPGYEWWVFLDALGQPIPEASVEIGLYDAAREAKVIVNKGKLDAKGRLKRIKGNFVFTISHPRYGIATTECSGEPSTQNLPQTYIVPLVPLDSPAAAGAIRGTVTDTQGQPVAGVTISCDGLISPVGEQLDVFGGKFQGIGVTNEQGRFAVYWPILKDGVPSDSLVPAGSQCRVRVEPGKSLNLRHYEGNIIAGAEAAITLSSMQADEVFHTFTFEGQAEPITAPEELKQATLMLFRDDRLWKELTYDQWKNGCSLPMGTLRAFTHRWGYPFSFKPADLRADSPQEIVIKEHDPITYRGQVVDGATAKPIPNALVFTGSPYASLDPCSMTPQRWQELHSRVTQQASAHFPDKIFYEYDNRMTATDANGEYAILFVPGMSPALPGLTAVQSGYAPISISIPGYIRPDADGIAQMPPFRLAPPTSPGPIYFPTFVVEDEKGPVNDPNKLKAVRLQIVSNGGWREDSLGDFLEQKQFTPGVYRATASWEGKYYVFEPVDLSDNRPETVVFKLKESLKDEIVFRGLVVHAVTGRAISRAVVTLHRMPARLDMSRLTEEQWKVIKSLGPDPSLTDPALAPLMQVVADAHAPPMSGITLTDAQGGFRIVMGRGQMDRGGRLIIVDKDFLATEQQLTGLARPTTDRTKPTSPQSYGSEANGQVMMPPIKLYPAGTVLLEPVAPEHAFSDGRKPQLSLSIQVDQNDPAPWLKDLKASPAGSYGASVSRRKDVLANTRQSLHVPADVTTALLLYDAHESRLAPLFLPGIRLRQGQSLDLGRLEFGPGVTVSVKVVDSAGKPVKEARVYCVDDRYGQYGMTSPTNSEGIAEAHVAPSTQGNFALYCFGRSTRDRLEASVAYEVAGPEDNGREFILQLSDEFLQRFRQQRSPEATPIQPLQMPTRYAPGQQR